jgi:hypothetical protein
MLREKIGRLDKVYCQRGGGDDDTATGGVRLVPSAMSLLGTTPCHVKASGDQVFPSDHAGIVSSFLVSMVLP